MAKTMKKVAVLAVAAVLSASVVGATACGEETVVPYEAKTGTYRTYTTVLPSNWNELTYEDNNDTQILYNIVSSFFEYDYQFEDDKKFNEDGSVNYDGIVDGGYTVKYSAATALEDVTSTVDAKWGYTDAQKKTGGYAWKITLRQDLTWDDGTPIDATDFVYTMQQQLDPLFQNMRASTYYNNIQLHNARNYVYQGQAGYFDNSGLGYTYDQLVLGSDNVYTLNGAKCYIALESPLEWLGGASLAQYVDAYPEYFDVDAYNSLAELVDEDGNVNATSEAIELLKKVITAQPSWGETEENVVGYLYAYYTYPEVDFEDVGLYAPSKYELVVCLDSPIQCLNEDGSLSYEAAYSFSSLPLVKEDLYEACKQEPAVGSTLWTTNYNTSVATSASWGPYKLTQFQGGNSYTLSRNDEWFGYDLEDNQNQYNVTKITCQVIADVNTSWMMFTSGQIDEIGIDVTHKDAYRNSKYTKYTPGTGTFGVNIYSNLDVLKTSGRNNGILAITEFRKAMSLGLDRDDYNATCYTSHQSCYGIMGPSYYYDIANSANLEDSGVYRNTQVAKEALLRVYGFTENGDGTWTSGTITYPTYEEAYDAMTGYDLAQAKELIEEAYSILTSDPEKYGYDASKPIEIKYGTSEDNEDTRRSYNYFVSYFEKLTKGTSLDGKINVTFDASFQSNWANAFKNGEYDLAPGTGFSGGAFDPAGFLQCYVDPDAGLMYSESWWDTKSESMTFTMPEIEGEDYEGEGEELTMSIYNWYCCLNGIAEAYGQKNTYNWGTGFAPEEARLDLLAALEELILEKYYTIITTSQYSATVYGAKWSTASDEYNVFMGFGGYRYLICEYNDAEWADFVASQNNNLESLYQQTN